MCFSEIGKGANLSFFLILKITKAREDTEKRHF